MSEDPRTYADNSRTSANVVELRKTPARLDLSYCEAGVTESVQLLHSWSPTFEELSDRFSVPEIGTKDGPYFIRGPFVEGCPSRSDENIAYASVVVLDGDKTVNPETGEIIEGAPHPLEVHSVLSGLGLKHLLYTSHSHGAKGNRYRVALPVSRPLANDIELLACTSWLIDRLHGKRVHLCHARENDVWSQPWYLPRVPDADAEKGFRHHRFDGETLLDPDECLQWFAQQSKNEAKELPERIPGPRNVHVNSPIGKYNAQHNDPHFLVGQLQEKGYEYQGARGLVNGLPIYRLLAQESASGKAGVRVFCTEYGLWRTVSSHDESHDDLAKERYEGGPASHDPFDLYRILEHGGDEAAALREWRRVSDTRPVVRIYGGSIPHNEDAAIRALSKTNPPMVYRRGLSLCRIAHLPEVGDVRGCTIPQGTATILPYQKAGLTGALAEAIRWEKRKEDEWHEADPHPKVVAGLLERVEKWDGLPNLVGISESPILRPDGILHSEAGYDPTTGLYVEGRTPRIELSDTVSLETAKGAAEFLLKPFAEFPFVESEPGDRSGLSVVLAYLLTLALRPQMPVAPLTCVSATTPGTGKGLLVEACNLIVRGRHAALMTALQSGNEEEETRKRITALLMQGVPSINLDNWTRPIGGNSMNSLLTTGMWSDRLLGLSETVSIPARIAMAATGNNLTVRGDMTRRTLLVRLDAGVERPELRTFEEPNLPGYVLRNRGDLLAALFAILKAYQQAGRPGERNDLLGGFEDWTSAVAAPIRWLGFPCPVDTQKQLRSEDPESERLEMLLTAWYAALGEQTATVSDLIKTAENALGPNTNVARRDLRDALIEIAGDSRGNVNRRSLGRYLSGFKDRISAGLVLRDAGFQTKHKGAKKYRVGKSGD